MAYVKAVVTSPVTAMDTSKLPFRSSAFSAAVFIQSARHGPLASLVTCHPSHVTFSKKYHSDAPAPKGELSGERDSFGTAEAMDQGG